MTLDPLLCGFFQVRGLVAMLSIGNDVHLSRNNYLKGWAQEILLKQRHMNTLYKSSKQINVANIRLNEKIIQTMSE